MRLFLCVALALAGCGDNLLLHLDAAPPADAAALPDAVDGDGAACTTSVTGYELAAGIHVAQCSPITYATNPPTSGEHYPIWAAYTTYDYPVPLGFLVHDLEHGAVVIFYNCPDGCAGDLSALQDYLDGRPADPTCTAAVHHRIVVTPDPDLDVRFAASAWGWALRSDCFDLGALDAFIDAHYAGAPEDLCGDGQPSPTCP